MIIDDENKFVFIAIPKTASTTVHIAFGHYNHPPPEEYHMSLGKCLTSFPHVKDYFKFCFVRNPFEKFVSTYFNLIDPKAGHTWATDLLKYKNFEEFCLDFPNTEFTEWVHFRPQYTFCYDSDVGMNYIGRQETFDKDFDIVCQRIGIPRPNTGRYRSSTHKSYNEYFKGDYDMIEIINDFYKIDLEYFKYEY